MLYEKYYKKTLKMSGILTAIYRFRVLISCIVLAVLAALATFMGVYGMVYETGECPSEITYGQQLDYETKSLFTSVSYEYSAADSDVWSSEFPKNTGSYKVRSVSKNIFGSARYGSEFAFAILPKEVDVYVSVSTVEYGSLPAVSADLAYSDTVVCTSVIYEDASLTSTGVTPDKNTVTITDKNGEDVTSNYIINCVKTNISFTQRNIEITLTDAEKVYDGTPLVSTEYTVTSGSLADGDAITATSQSQITNVGEAENSVEFTITSGDGTAVTANYNITVNAGTLTVTAREVYIATGSTTFEYDGQEHSLSEYEIEDSTAAAGLISGHGVGSISSYTGATEAGEYENKLELVFTDEDGEDVTANYSLVYDYGTLTVAKREITVKTNSHTQQYTATALYDDTYSITEGSLAAEQTVSIQSYAQITEAGSVQNAVILGIYAGESEVTSNYEITYDYGTLTITRIQITVTTEGAEKTYDGTPLTNGGYSVEGSVVEGQTLTVTVTGSQTATGSSDNTAQATVTDGSGADVTANYDITINAGTLTVNGLVITVTTNSASKEYDGVALTAEGYQITKGSLAKGHTAEAGFYAQITEVGEIKNTFNFAIYEGETNVTANYSITYVYGTLTVNKRSITVATNTHSREYDGTALYDYNYSLSSGSIPSGHTANIDSYAQITEVGSTTNTVILSIYEGETNVTGNYNITYEYGTLTITQRAITVTADSAEKEYDGTPLTANSYKVTSGSVAGGQSITVEISGSQTAVGKSDNIIVENSIQITDENGNIVTGNYTITTVAGTLEVTLRVIVLTAGSDSKVYDGTALTCNDYTQDGLLDGHTLTVTVSGSLTNVGVGANSISSYTITDDSGANVESLYTIKTAEGTLTVTARPITITTSSAEKVYDATALTADTQSDWSLSEGSLADNQTLTVEITGTQTNAGSSENTFNATIKDDNGSDVTSNYDITAACGTLTVTPRPVTVKTGTESWTYDGYEHYNTSYEIVENQELEEKNEYGILNGDSVSIVSYPTITNVIIVDNEIKLRITNINGDVTSNYKITYEYGTLTINPREITVITYDAEKVYDGTALYDYYYTITDGTLADYQTASVASYAQLTNVDEIENEVVLIIKDSSQNDVTDNYDITYNYGTLKVTKRPITFTTGTSSWVYDGYEHYDESFDVTAGSYAPYQSAVVGSHTTIKNVNTETVNNVLELIIQDSSSNDVTGNYDVTYIYGTLTVTVREITLTTYDQEKVYDGTPLYYDTYTIGGAGLADYQYEEVTYYAQLTNVGELENKVEIIIKDSSGNYVTSNYSISYTYGTLEVTPRPVTFNTGSYEWVYDGQEHYCDDFEVDGSSAYGVADGQTAYVYEHTTITNVGTETNYLTIKIKDSSGNDVTDNYDISYNAYGTLEVTARYITVTSDSKSWLYEGLTHSCNSDEVTEGELAEGQTINFTFTAEGLTDVGTATNTFTLIITDIHGNDVTENYSITCEYGTLVVFSPLTLNKDQSYDFTAEATGNFVFTLQSGNATFSVNGEEAFTISKNGASYTIALEQGDIVTIYANYSSAVTCLYRKEGGSLDTSGKIGGGDLGGGGTSSLIMEVYSEESGSLYFKLISYGDYTGTSWSQADEYDGYITINGTEYSLSYLYSLALENSSYSDTEIQVKNYSTDYLLPYYLSVNEDGEYTIQTSDVYYTSDYTGSTYEYSFYVYYYDYLTSGSDGLELSSDYAAIEAAYYEYVKENYLNVPTDTLEYLQTIIEEQKFYTSDTYTLISQVADYIKNAATYNLNYDRALDDEDDIVVAFLKTYKQGICQHYASAATLLFRALGIPARYTIGYYAETSAGEWTEVTTITAHAWVEVYISGLGWVAVDVTGSADGGSGSGVTGDIIIKPVDIVGQYGTELTATDITGYDEDSTYMLNYLLHLGYTYAVTFGGSQTEEGSSASTITSFVLYYPDGSVCNDYSFGFEEGTLTVTDKVVVTIHLFDISKEYDGTALSYNEDDYYCICSDNTAEYTVEINGLSSITLTNYGVITIDDLNAAITAGTITITVYKDGQEVTDDSVYVYIYDVNLLTVFRRSITITTASATKEYDGTALTTDTNNSWWISFGSLASGDTLSVTVTGSVTTGSGYNTIDMGSIAVTHTDTTDVTKNYLITYVLGTLEVTYDTGTADADGEGGSE